MDDVVKDQWLLSFYNNFNSCFIIPIMIILNGEIPILFEFKHELTVSYFGWVFVAGLIGLFVGLTTQLQIKYTSTLSHNISGVVKNCIQTFMGALFFKTQITLKGVCGVLLVVGGSFSYAYERIQINQSIDLKHKEQTTKLLNVKNDVELQEASVIDD